MEDKERIGILIQEIKKYFGDLEDIKFSREGDLDDLKYYASSMIIFSIINKTIDLGKEIVVSRNLGVPKNYSEVFSLIKKKRIISLKMEKDLINLIFLRNKISHRYEGVNRKDILRAKNELKVVKDFIKIVLKEIRK